MIKRKVIVEQVAPGMELYRRESVVEAVKGYFRDRPTKKRTRAPRGTIDTSGIPARLKRAYVRRVERARRADADKGLFDGE